ncbi:MAG: hypothetical protein HC859_01175 [Bacteroidia bacterium]|nr:hypothetical protein [Bacteroidia bacterium]
MSRGRASIETDLIRLVTTLLRLVAGAALAVVVIVVAMLSYPFVRKTTKVSDTRNFSGSGNLWSPPGIERLAGPRATPCFMDANS